MTSTNTSKSLTSYAAGDLVEYKMVGWMPAENWLITRAWFQFTGLVQRRVGGLIMR